MKVSTTMLLTALYGGDAAAFTGPAAKSVSRHESSSSQLRAKPQRLQENVDGVVYVNDRCINCAACSGFAPETFSRSPADRAHIVHQQPSTPDEIVKARSALAACPVAAIRVETLAERRHGAADKELVEQLWSDHDDLLVQQMTSKDDGPPFPRVFLDDAETFEGVVYWLGHHSERSFGAVPYLMQTTYQNKLIWVMVDTPKYTPSAIRAVESLTGPEGPAFLFLSHVDDSADHDKWATHYDGQLKRIFHSGDLGRHNWVGDTELENVEVLLPNVNVEGDGTLTAYNLDGEVLPADWYETSADETVVLHTPGHSPGSITLYRRPNPSKQQPGMVFTGDTYGWTTRGGGKMTGFGQYGNNLQRQTVVLQHLVNDLEWDVVAPGHGHPRDYRGAPANVKQTELEGALADLKRTRRW